MDAENVLWSEIRNYFFIQPKSIGYLNLYLGNKVSKVTLVVELKLGPLFLHNIYEMQLKILENILLLEENHFQRKLNHCSQVPINLMYPGMVS